MAGPDLVRVGVLDFGLCEVGASQIQRLRQTTESAQAAESLGFYRYWLGEHNPTAAPWSYPIEVLRDILDATSKIRVGAGGILAGLHEPSKIAEDFLALAAAHPARLDLGIARGRLTPSVSTARITHTVATLSNAAHSRVIGPSLWILGNSRASAMLATSLSAGFAINGFLPAKPQANILQFYEREWRSSDCMPSAILAISGLVCETREEALDLIADENPFITINFVGGLDDCRRRIVTIAKRFYASELMFLDLSPTHKVKLRSLELLARVALSV